MSDTSTTPPTEPMPVPQGQTSVPQAEGPVQAIGDAIASAAETGVGLAQTFDPNSTTLADIKAEIAAVQAQFDKYAPLLDELLDMHQTGSDQGAGLPFVLKGVAAKLFGLVF